MYHMGIKYQTAKKYTKTLYSKAFRNTPKLGLLVYYVIHHLAALLWSEPVMIKMCQIWIKTHLKRQTQLWIGLQHQGSRLFCRPIFSKKTSTFFDFFSKSVWSHWPESVDEIIFLHKKVLAIKWVGRISSSSVNVNYSGNYCKCFLNQLSPQHS
jgi:hypothetical protein